MDSIAWWTGLTALLVALGIGVDIWLDRRRAPRIAVKFRLGQVKDGRIMADYFLLNAGPIPAQAVRTGITAISVQGDDTLRLYPVGEKIDGEKSPPGKLHAVENLGQGQYHLYADLTKEVQRREDVYLHVFAVTQDARYAIPYLLTWNGDLPVVKRISWRTPAHQIGAMRRSRAGARRRQQDYV